MGGDGEGEGRRRRGRPRSRLGRRLPAWRQRSYTSSTSSRQRPVRAVRRKRRRRFACAQLRTGRPAGEWPAACQPGRFQRQARRPAQPRVQQFDRAGRARAAECGAGRARLHRWARAAHPTAAPERRRRGNRCAPRPTPGGFRISAWMASRSGWRACCCAKVAGENDRGDIGCTTQRLSHVGATDGADLRGERGDQLGAAIAERLSRRARQPAQRGGKSRSGWNRCTAQPDRPRVATVGSARAVSGNQVCSRSLINVRKSSPKIARSRGGRWRNMMMIRRIR